MRCPAAGAGEARTGSDHGWRRSCPSSEECARDRADRQREQRYTRGDSEIVLAKRSGKAVRFKETDVRAMGRAATGVRGATLEGADDQVIGMVAVSRPESQLLVVTGKGYGKRTAIDAYRLTARGTKGVITLRVTERNGPLVAIREVVDGDGLMLITSRGTLIRLPVSGISQLGRATQGVHLVRLGDEDRVVA
ncbi:MAG TPA: DNA gyrase C-terminal beta-propeller domain-containing protein, partial [Acidimicrobiales bacterium]